MMKIELAHDLLAKKIHEKASQEDRKLMEIRQFIQQRFAHFEKNHVLLAREDLNYIKPYLNRLSLRAHEIRFIERSKNRLIYYGITVGALAVFVLGVIGYFIVQNDKIQERSRNRIQAELERYEEMNQHANELSNALIESQQGLDATKEELRLALLALQAKNDTLVEQYARYKVEQSFSKQQLEEERNIAQSAKLSGLAAASLEKNRGYAFRLADKAWYLNQDNDQAMRVLHQIAQKTYQPSRAKQYTFTIIKNYRKTWGTLSPKELNAIFTPKNKLIVTNETTVPQQVIQSIQQPAPPAARAPIPTQQIIEEEFIRHKKEIQRQMEDVKLDIRQQRQQIRQKMPSGGIKPE